MENLKEMPIEELELHARCFCYRMYNDDCISPSDLMRDEVDYRKVLDELENRGIAVSEITVLCFRKIEEEEEEEEEEIEDGKL